MTNIQSNLTRSQQRPVDPGNPATDSGQPEAGRAEAERTAQVSCFRSRPQLSESGLWPGSLHEHQSGAQQTHQMPILMNGKVQRHLGPPMSKEASREMADGSCRNEDEKAYERSQASFAPGPAISSRHDTARWERG